MTGQSDDGVRLIPITTPSGEFRIWTRTVGDSPDIKLLLLHGGPGATHEQFENSSEYLLPAGIEHIYYDQLGSWYSDQPDDPNLWELDRFVDEVEQVRRALGLDRSNFFLLGQSWGGILAIEYALRHQEHLKGLVISNMMSSCPAYNAYARDVLMPAMDQGALAEIKGFEASGDTDNPRYTELLIEHHYRHHVLRLPPDQWPEPINRLFAHINPKVYVPMQGPSELGLSGTLSDWDRTDDLAKIEVPTLVIGARHDTMDPRWMRMMAGRLPKGRYLECPNGGHLANWDDADVYFAGLVDFLRNAGRSSPEQIKATFEHLAIPEAERKLLAGVGAQCTRRSSTTRQGRPVEARRGFMGTDQGLKEYPEIFKKYFGTVVPAEDNNSPH